MNGETLLPCAHCGGKPMEIILNPKENTGFYDCEQCLISTPIKKMDEARKIWNRRTA
jgi:hypothetical protein